MLKFLKEYISGYDVESVSIIQGDPFAAGILGGGEHWDGAEEAIIYKKRLKNQIWWTTTVRPEFKVLINCCEEDIEVEHQGEILLARHYIDSTLLSNGVLIRRIHKENNGRGRNKTWLHMNC